MKAALAIALVVAVAGFVECMPQLKESVQARLAKLQTKRGEGEDFDWPYAWIEFSQLIGKCESTRNLLEAFDITLSEEDEEYCILAKACPKAIKLGESYLGATEDAQKELAKSVETLFPLLQCVNLEAVKESVEFALYLNEAPAEGNVYLQETDQLFNLCQMVFAKVEEEEQKFEEEMRKAEDIVGGKKRALQAELRKLISIASRKF